MNLNIQGSYITLGQLLKFANLIESGGMAKQIIQDGLVLVNDSICTQRGKKLYRGDRVTYQTVTVTISTDEPL